MTNTNTYEDGYVLAKNDIARHGFAMALDKMQVLEGAVLDGYSDAVHGLSMNIHLTDTSTI